MLSIYDFVTVHQTPQEYYKTPIARYRRAPNAFVLSARTGKVLASFRYDGYYETLGYTVPRHYVWQTKTYYLVDTEHQLLRLIPRDKPQLTSKVSLRELPKFKLPKRPNELRFQISNEQNSSAFYVDTITQQLRYQYLP